MNICQNVIKLIHRTAIHSENNSIIKIRRSMPKKSTGAGGKGQIPQVLTNKSMKSPVSETKDGNLSIAIQVKPGAKFNSITDISEEIVSVQIAAPPVDGEANIAIIKYFAELINVKKADVSLKGGKSRQKVVTIGASTGLDSVKILEILESHKS